MRNNKNEIHFFCRRFKPEIKANNLIKEVLGINENNFVIFKRGKNAILKRIILY